MIAAPRSGVSKRLGDRVNARSTEVERLAKRSRATKLRVGNLKETTHGPDGWQEGVDPEYRK